MNYKLCIRSKVVVLIWALIFISAFGTEALGQTDEAHPNILLIISDDIGVDHSRGYHDNSRLPETPAMDKLRSAGITFENVFSAPVCSPTRAAILTGKYGIKNGVSGVPGNLELEHTSLFTELKNRTNGVYDNALIGKWHLTTTGDKKHPEKHGADYFNGILGGAVEDYYVWKRTFNGTDSIDSTYVTSALTDEAINWIQSREKPWFLWLAHVAAHTPTHVPPEHMFTVENTDNTRRQYRAMIEALDYEIDRLLNAIPDSVRENTVVIYVGDNGTPGNLLNDYPDGHGKGSLYQGGIRVPLIISGAGVNRQGEREVALVHVADLFATILELSGEDLPGGMYNSLSFEHQLKGEEGPERDYSYLDMENDGATSWTIRNKQYKLIHHSDESEEFYDLLADSLEINDLLLGGLSPEQVLIMEDLLLEAETTQTSWSCRDHIQNGDETGIDCGGTYCEPCITGTDESKETLPELRLYPNPVKDKFSIRLSTSTQGYVTLYLYDLHGVLRKEIHRGELPEGNQHFEVNTTDLAPGLYVLYAEVGGKVGVRKLLITGGR
jgi:arylsulfatase A-like enzyme